MVDEIVGTFLRRRGLEIGIEGMHGEVHVGEAPGHGVGFLAEDGKQTLGLWCFLLAWASTNCSGWINMPPEPQQGS